MTKRKWAAVKRVFTEAVRLDGVQRDLYLKSACRDEEVRREVESLVAEHDKHQDFPAVYSSVGGRTLSHYDIHERIGEGGIAIVYRARDTLLNRWVALKVLQPWAMAQPSSQQQLIAEARAVSGLNHPNIVTVHEVANAGEVWFIVMEYIDGKTLDRWIPSTGLPLPDALNHAMQVADALRAAHAAGIVHGDLKPMNVIVTNSGHVKLLDFGLATALGSQIEPAQALNQLGTTAFMAPEQLQGRRISPDLRSDIFSFGVVLYQMSTGRHPFGAGTRAQVARAIRDKRPEPFPISIPVPLAKVIQRCMEKDPAGRFQSMEDVISALTLIRRQSVPDAQSPRKSRTHAHADLTDPDIRHVAAIAGQIDLSNIPRSWGALSTLQRVVGNGISPALRTLILTTLRDFLQTNPAREGSVISPSIRQLRKEAIRLINAITQGDLGSCFKDLDLADLDLYGMNFSQNQLSGFSFRRSFVVEADFQGSNLTGASFSGANIRNTNFAAADLSDADFTGADWFNALGLTQEQLRSVRQGTLLECPPTIQAMRRYLENHYVLPFDSWAPTVQEQLNAAWREYWRSGGRPQKTTARRV